MNPQKFAYIISSFLFLIAAAAFSQPGTPSLSSPANGMATTSTAITFSWNAVSSASSYNLQVSQNSSLSSVIINQSISATSQIISGFSIGSVYYWRVSATGTGGTGAWSSAWSYSIGTIPSVPAPISPANGALLLSATLAWSSMSGASSYGMQVSTTPVFVTTVSSINNLTGTTMAISNLPSYAYYYWRINAASIYGTSAWSNMWSFAIISSVPEVPVLATPINGSVNVYPSVSCQWYSVNLCAAYSLQISSSSNFSSTISTVSNLTNSTGRPSSPLPNNSLCFWRVNASNILGASGWSSVWSFTTSFPIPGKPLLTAPLNYSTQDASTALSWGIVLGAERYHLGLGYMGKNPISKIPDLILLSLIDTTLPSTSWSNPSMLSKHVGATIKWWLYAYNGAGNGPLSDTFSFVVGSSPVLSSTPPVSAGGIICFRNSYAIYDLPSARPVSLSLFTLSGRRIPILDLFQPAGHYSVSLKNYGLASGAYFMHFKAGRVERKIKILLDKE